MHWHVKRVTESDGGVCCRQGIKTWLQWRHCSPAPGGTWKWFSDVVGGKYRLPLLRTSLRGGPNSCSILYPLFVVGAGQESEHFLEKGILDDSFFVKDVAITLHKWNTQFCIFFSIGLRVIRNIVEKIQAEIYRVLRIEFREAPFSASTFLLQQGSSSLLGLLSECST